MTLFNRLSLYFMAEIYGRINRREGQSLQSLWETHYPWASRGRYFHCFGPRGLFETHILIPDEALDTFIPRFEVLFRDRRLPAAVCVTKRFDGEQRLLRFNGRGVSFGIEIPGFTGAAELSDDLLRLCIDCGGKTALYKSSRVTPEVIDACYPEADAFRSALVAFDPKRRMATHFSARAGL